METSVLPCGCVYEIEHIVGERVHKCEHGRVFNIVASRKMTTTYDVEELTGTALALQYNKLLSG